MFKMSENKSTKTKILDAAEILFAKGGFAETSMRAITEKAGVNLAAINYHFGSKNSLTIAVLDRYLKHLMPGLSSALAHLRSSKTAPNISDVLESFVTPLMDLDKVGRGGTVCFLKLLGRGYIDVQGQLKLYILETYCEDIEIIKESLRQSAPHLSEEELFWRIHFTLGTSVFTLAASDALMEISKSDYQTDIDTKGILERLLPFLGAGFSAINKSSTEK